MKPLSSIIYAKNNKGKTFSSMQAIVIAVFFIMILYTFFETIEVLQINKTIKPMEYSNTISSLDEKDINKETLEEIKEKGMADYLIPTSNIYTLRYMMPGISDRTKVLGLKEKDMNTFLEKQHMELISGRLPKEGEKEIAISEFILKNRNCNIGDMVGTDIDEFDTLPGSFKIVGVLKGDGFYSIYPWKEDEFSGTYFIFPKEGQIDKLGAYLESFDKEKFDIATLEKTKVDFNSSMDIIKTLDLITIISLVVIVIIVGISKYAEFLNRKEEIGLLNALGYSKGYLLKRAFLEALVINVLGLVIGIIIGVGVNALIKQGLWSKLGVDLALLLTWKSVFMSLLLAMFTTLFTLIPINNLINKIDPIKTVEGD